MDIQDVVFSTTAKDNAYEEYFMGADWARSSDGTSLVVIGRSRSGKMALVDLVNLHNIEYSKQIEVAKRMFEKW